MAAPVSRRALGVGLEARDQPALAVVAFVTLLYLGSNLTFRGDEWGMILHAEDWSIDRLMEPHTTHWALGTRVLWNTLQAGFGLTSYVPYLAVALAFHVDTWNHLDWVDRFSSPDWSQRQRDYAETAQRSGEALLAIVGDIVEAYGGTLTIEASSLGGAATATAWASISVTVAMRTPPWDGWAS